MAVLALMLPIACAAFESDVHFGLTRWLATRAGFSESQAEAIAVADQRVDGGLVESVQLGLEYACAGRFADVAKQVQAARYPASNAIPAPLADRAVQPGSAAARRELADVARNAKGKEGLMLGRFGRALHSFQDAWSHQGAPSSPPFGNALECDATLVSAHPAARGGPASHAADLTMQWPDDVLAMAAATYDEMLRYGAVEGQVRKPAAWDSLVAPILQFAKAKTKTQKREWFAAQGMGDARFLGGTSLPDGPNAGALEWNGGMLPPLPGDASKQHDAPVEVRAFFDTLLARWLSTRRVEDVVAEMGPGKSTSAQGETAPSAAELTARLKLWKLRDHGSAAELAHAPAPLSATQLKAVDRMTRDASASLPAMGVAEAVYPLQPSTPAPMPMLPYIVRALPPAGGAPRMIAIARLRHAPYDTVGWIAEQRAGRWVLTTMVSMVDL